MTLNLNMSDKILSREEIRSYSPAALAFFGDCAWEILVRRYILSGGNAPSGKLHNRSVEMVRASYQSAAAELIEDILTEEEADIFRRGRNASGIQVPKSSTPAEYHRATGLDRRLRPCKSAFRGNFKWKQQKVRKKEKKNQSPK